MKQIIAKDRNHLENLIKQEINNNGFRCNLKFIY